MVIPTVIMLNDYSLGVIKYVGTHGWTRHNALKSFISCGPMKAGFGRVP